MTMENLDEALKQIKEKYKSMPLVKEATKLSEAYDLLRNVRVTLNAHGIVLNKDHSNLMEYWRRMKEQCDATQVITGMVVSARQTALQAKALADYCINYPDEMLSNDFMKLEEPAKELLYASTPQSHGTALEIELEYWQSLNAIYNNIRFVKKRFVSSSDNGWGELKQPHCNRLSAQSPHAGNEAVYLSNESEKARQGAINEPQQTRIEKALQNEDFCHLFESKHEATKFAKWVFAKDRPLRSVVSEYKQYKQTGAATLNLEKKGNIKKLWEIFINAGIIPQETKYDTFKRI